MILDKFLAIKDTWVDTGFNYWKFSKFYSLHGSQMNVSTDLVLVCLCCSLDILITDISLLTNLMSFYGGLKQKVQERNYRKDWIIIVCGHADTHLYILIFVYTLLINLEAFDKKI